MVERVHPDVLEACRRASGRPSAPRSWSRPASPGRARTGTPRGSAAGRRRPGGRSGSARGTGTACRRSRWSGGPRVFTSAARRRAAPARCSSGRRSNWSASGVGGLGVLADPARGGHELLAERLLDLRQERRVLRRVLLLAEDAPPRAAGGRSSARRRPWRSGPCRSSRPGSRTRSWRRRASRRSGSRSFQRFFVAGLAPHVLDPRLHARVLPLEEARVAVGQVHVPGDDRRRVGPGRGAAGELAVLAQHVGHDEAARCPLGSGRRPRRPSHFVKKPATSMLKRGGAREDLRVARPAQPLVALRAVGGHVEEVALLAPAGCCAGAGSAAGSSVSKRPVTGMSEWTTTPVSAVERRLARPALDRDVAEALEGEVRLVHLVRAALEDVASPAASPPAGWRCRSCRPCRAPRRGAASPSSRPARAPSGARGPPCSGPCRRPSRRRASSGPSPAGPPRSSGPAGPPGRRATRSRGLDHDDGRPVRVRVARGAPARALQPGVVGLAVVDVRAADRPRRRLPRPVGPHGLDAAVRVLDPELAEQREAVAVDVAPVLPGEEAAVPAVAERRADRVLARRAGGS